jgi:hypothetical protein
MKAVAVACKHYPDEGGGHGGDHADSFAHDEVPHVGYEANKVHHDDDCHQDHHPAGRGCEVHLTAVHHHRDCHPAGSGRGSGGCQEVATEDFLLIIIKIATLLGVVEDLVTFTFEKVDKKSTQEQLTIKTATLLGVDKLLVGAGVATEDVILCKIGQETQDWVIH